MDTEMKELMGAVDKLDDRMTDAEIAIQKLYTAFPGGDVEGHRRYHDAMIEKTAEMRRLRIAIQEKTISGLIWAFIVGAAVMAWNSFLHFIGK